MAGTWDTIVATLAAEFSDLTDVEQLTRVVVRMLIAVALGGLIGYERERRGAAAGLRTHMLVSLGSALFVLLPLQAGMGTEGVSRVLGGVIAGVGFLGAGTIWKNKEAEEVTGLTTAASIWLAAAIGVTAGMGREVLAIISALLALVVLAALRHAEHRNHRRESGK